jgi:hypothetical protein
VRWGPKTLIAVTALLFAIGLAACGGGGDSSSAKTESTAQGQAGSDSSGNSSNGKTKNGGGESTAAAGEGGSSEGSGDFVPKQHNDSGGGSEQFRVKGGDNSVQEFGAEADTSERDEAAAALHDFLDARGEGNFAAACSYLAKSVTVPLEKLAAKAKQIQDKSCAGIFEKLTNPSPAARGELRAEAAKADVGSLRTKGDQAFLIYRGVGGTVLAMPMANEGGSWKVGSLAGTPLS